MNPEEREVVAGLSRRDFLRASGTVALAALAGSEARLLAGSSKIVPRADSLILLWMAGGMAQTETFDPDLYTPFEPGMESKRVLSTFLAIDTAVDDIKISAGLERIAKIMDRGTLIRSHRVGDLVYSTADGRIVWDVDTAVPYQTVNGVKAKGGSLDGPGPTVVGGTLHVNSGSGTFAEMPGNVLLAFSVDGK